MGDFLSPDEVKKLNKKEKKRVIVDNNFEPDEDINESEVSSNEQLEVSESISPKNTAGLAKIQYETMGRFDIPKVLHFSGYTVDNIDSFALVDEDNVFETVISILSDLSEDKEVPIGDMLVEDFFETLIGIKAQFNTIDHVHKWLCDCQDGKNDRDKIINETHIDLSKLNYTSIEQADEKYRNIMSDTFKNAEIFANYLKLKYGKDAIIEEYSVEDEIAQLKITEPFTIPFDGHIYKLKFMRVKDILHAHQYVLKKYNSKIKAIKNKVMHGVKQEELQEIKEEELQNLQREKAKDFLRALKASALCEYDGEPLELIDHKISIYKNLPIEISLNMNEFLDQIRFGVDDEHTYECPICGYSEGRSLQHEFNFIEFIPTKSSSNNGLRDITRGNIFMGI